MKKEREKKQKQKKGNSSVGDPPPHNDSSTIFELSITRRELGGTFAYNLVQ